MQREPRHDNRDTAWSSQESALLAAFLVGGLVFIGATFYALGIWREPTQVAGVIPPPITGERVPVIPRLE